MSVDLHPQLWWYLARASGLVAWVASGVSIGLGLALATRALGNRPRPAWLLDLHRLTGALVVAFLGLHLGALVADSWVHFDVVDLLVPFASSWRPVAVAAGVVAMWMLVTVEVTGLAMKRIPRATWRKIHLTSYVAFALSTAHTFAAGADAANPAVRGFAVVSVGGIAFFVVYRLLMPRRAAARKAAAARRSRPAPVAAAVTPPTE